MPFRRPPIADRGRRWRVWGVKTRSPESACVCVSHRVRATRIAFLADRGLRHDRFLCRTAAKRARKKGGAAKIWSDAGRKSDVI